MGPWELTDHSRLPLGDAGDALAWVNMMWKKGWIRPLKKTVRGRIASSTNIQLTVDGIDYAEKLMQPKYGKHIKNVYMATIEGITRGLTRK